MVGDAALAYLDLSITPVELFVSEDAQIVELTLLPLSTELAEYADDALVYLDLEAGSIVIQIDFILEVLGMVARWHVELPLARWSITGEQTRWIYGDLASKCSINEAISRWSVLEQRQFTWRA